MPSWKIKAMDSAARRVLDAHRSTGAPFCLFLSSWSFDKQRATLLEILDRIEPGETQGKVKRDVQVRIGLERQVRIVLQQFGLDTLAIYRKGDEKRIAQPDEWPSLSLADDAWRTGVSELVTQADLVVLFWGKDTPGLEEEIEMCASGSTPWKTIVVRAASPREIWMSQVWKWFPRIVPLDEVPPIFGLHAEFMPLIDRMKQIKKIDPSVRKEIIDPQARLRKFPLPPGSRRFDGDLWIEVQPGGGKGDNPQTPGHNPVDMDSATTKSEEPRSDPTHAKGSESNASLALSDHSIPLQRLIARRAFQEEVVALYPENAEAQAKLAGIHVAIGDVLLEQGALSDAAGGFHAALAIVQRLAAADSGTLGMQRLIAMAHTRLSYVFSATGDFAEAVAELETSLVVRTRLAEAEPDNPQWKGELVVTYEKVGDLWQRIGRHDSALHAYQSAVLLVRHLTQLDPYHISSWQRDLASLAIRIEAAKQALLDSRDPTGDALN